MLGIYSLAQATSAWLFGLLNGTTSDTPFPYLSRFAVRLQQLVKTFSAQPPKELHALELPFCTSADLSKEVYDQRE
jgi:hypothetical protein